MTAFTQRCPDDLHAAMRAFLNDRSWLNQNELVNGAISAMIGFPEYRIDTAPPTLDDYVSADAMNDATRNALRGALIHGNRILIVGPPNSGRSSLLRAVLREYQRLANPARAMTISVDRDAQLAKIQPLLAMRLDHPDTRAKGVRAVPEWIDTVFADGLRIEEMPGVLEAWSQGKGGAITQEGTSFDWESNPKLNALVNVRVLLSGDRKIAMMLDNLPHENTPEKIAARRAELDAAREADYLFDDLVGHYETLSKLVRRGPNSGRSPNSMTRRASIASPDGAIGLLEVSTVMTSAASHKRVLTWTTNVREAPNSTGRPKGSSTHELSSFEQAISIIDG